MIRAELDPMAASGTTPLTEPLHQHTLTAELPAGQLHVRIDRSELPAEQLFSFAARNNPKRAFLFLSHVLGKHLPVRPAVMQDIHQRLARAIPALPGPVIFVGMAETATCLGQGVFEAWLAQHPDQRAVYLHTSRYRVDGLTRLAFEEAHSHAPDLWLHVPADPDLASHFHQARSLVLLDDEISTGSTFVNLARVCQQQAPGIEHVHLGAITDFTGPVRRAALRAAFGVPCSIGALLDGQWQFQSNGLELEAPPPAQASAGQTPALHDPGLGRCGRSQALTLPTALVQALSRDLSAEHRLLVLGTGEFMHPPFVLARQVAEHCGAAVWMHATTRSPILSWGPIQQVLRFSDNYGEAVGNYLYNHQPGPAMMDQYDQVWLCHETGPTPSLQALARQLGARLLHFRSEFEIEENPVC